MQNEDGFFKNQLLIPFQKKKNTEKKKRNRKSLAARAHFLTSRAAFSPLLWGMCLSISRAIWDGALDSSPQECGQWTMPSFRGSQKEKGACQTRPHAHRPAISCLWATPGEVPVFAWHSGELVSFPALFLNEPHSF